ncbi:hypothetical protein CBS101457_000174 [Exobasidium rhododendri]|nr:hypothetical protein CBS101457_000174 [Exobasidium rhododendri]
MNESKSTEKGKTKKRLPADPPPSDRRGEGSSRRGKEVLRSSPRLRNNPSVRMFQMYNPASSSHATPPPEMRVEWYTPAGNDDVDYYPDLLPNNAEMELASLNNLANPLKDNQDFPRSDRHYRPPYEYTLRVDPSFPFKSLDEKVWEDLTPEQHKVIVELVQQVRPDTMKQVRKHFKRELTAQHVLALLGKSRRNRDEVIEQLFPIKDGKDTWMNGLSKGLRIEVMNRMADATLQSKVDLRQSFRDMKIGPGVVHEILAAESDEELMEIAVRYELLRDLSHESKWKRGLSLLQQYALFQRVMGSGLVVDRHMCHDILHDSKVPLGYGLKMLRASTDHFTRAILFLLGQSEDPLL